MTDVIPRPRASLAGCAGVTLALPTFLATVISRATADVARAQSTTAEAHRAELATLTDLPGRGDLALRERFLEEYEAVRTHRELLGRWLPILGIDGVLDALEARTAGASAHHPCDAHAEYPPACYKYAAWRILQERGTVDAAGAHCLALSPPQRRGCFYGLGGTQMKELDHSP